MKNTKEATEAPSPKREGVEERAPYQAPRIVKKRAVSRATLFTGSGPDGGGVIGTPG